MKRGYLSIENGSLVRFTAEAEQDPRIGSALFRVLEAGTICTVELASVDGSVIPLPKGSQKASVPLSHLQFDEDLLVSAYNEMR